MSIARLEQQTPTTEVPLANELGILQGVIQRLRNSTTPVVMLGSNHQYGHMENAYAPPSPGLVSVYVCLRLLLALPPYNRSPSVSESANWKLGKRGLTALSAGFELAHRIALR